MTTPIATWYFDVISPYAYLHFKQFARLSKPLDITCKPVLFAGLLKHWATKGPAELPAKRVHTYRHCVWLARVHDIPFAMPPRHPFNPLKVLRLLTALEAVPSAVGTAFDFIWGEGRDVDAEWPLLCERLGVSAATSTIDDPLVKQRLLDNTNEALANGVWGVPTFSVGGELFWGADTIDFMNAYLADPDLFKRPEMRRADTAEIGVARKI